MAMARGETDGDRGDASPRGEAVAGPAIIASAAFAAHGEALRRYLTAFTRDAGGAEDLTQETFVKLLVETTAGRPPVALRAWLFRVATNLATSRARRERVASRRAPEAATRTTAPSPEEELLAREAEAALTRRLAILSEDARTAIWLAAHGYSGAEISERIGRSPLATRSLLSRQRSRLRVALSGTGP